MSKMLDNKIVLIMVKDANYLFKMTDSKIIVKLRSRSRSMSGEGQVKVR